MSPMREDLVPVPEALELILAGAEPLGEELVTLREARERILARDVASTRTQPPFAASAMDGYAVRAADIAAAPVELAVIGESAAGRAYKGGLGSGQAVRIFTGAPVPNGADAVVMQENTSRVGDRVTILKAAPAGKSVRAAGLDFREGEILLASGRRLDPISLALAASMNHPALPVHVRPLVAIASTGDELRLPGEAPGDDQIISSNAFGLAALVERSGGNVLDMGIVGDRREELLDFYRECLDRGADLVVTTGGASVGDHDLVGPVLRELGAKLLFQKVRIRPGKPLLAGMIAWNGRTVRLLGLAGNPVSAMVAGHVFLAPLVGRLAGMRDAASKPVTARLGRDIAANDERDDYLRATARLLADGSMEVEPFAVQDSSMLATLSRANALLIRPAHAPAASRGDACTAILLRAPLTTTEADGTLQA